MKIKYSSFELTIKTHPKYTRWLTLTLLGMGGVDNIRIPKDRLGEVIAELQKHVPIPVLEVPNFAYGIPIGNYISMDLNGTWSQDSSKPTRNASSWYCPGGYVEGTAESINLPWHDWRDSLFHMTEKRLVKV